MSISRRSLVISAAAASVGAVLSRAMAAPHPTVTVYKGAT
jgi:hypothetical protein